MKKNVLQDWLSLAGLGLLMNKAIVREIKHRDNSQTEAVEKHKWWEHDNLGMNTCCYFKGYHSRLNGMVYCRRSGGIRYCHGQAGCKQYEKIKGVK